MSAAMNWICSVDIKPYGLQTAGNMCVAQFIRICATHLLYSSQPIPNFSAILQLEILCRNKNPVYTKVIF